MENEIKPISENTKNKMNEFFDSLINEYNLVQEGAIYQISFSAKCISSFLKEDGILNVRYNKFEIGNLETHIITNIQ